MSFRQDAENELSFLQHIVADPADDLPRLVYADWLEERGEPRAEYIRIQVALAGADHRPDEAAALTNKAASLYWKHHRYWNGQVYRRWIGTPLEGKRVHLGGLGGWQYRRGFPEILEINAEFFVRYADLFLGAAPFQEIVLRRPPQHLSEFLFQHESLLKRFRKITLPNVGGLSTVPPMLVERIRIGLRVPRTLGEYRVS